MFKCVRCERPHNTDGNLCPECEARQKEIDQRSLGQDLDDLLFYLFDNVE